MESHMKGLIILGLALVVLGGGLMIWGYIPHEEKHSANVLGIEMSVTEKHRTKIPVALSGTLLGLGAAITIAGALKSRKG
jgi:hypothetical protein